MAEWRPSDTQRARIAYRRQQSLRRGTVAVVSTVLVLTALVVLTVTSPGWDRVRAEYFDLSSASEVLPDLARAFVLNIKLFLVTGVLVLVVAIGVAVIRVVPSPALAPRTRLGVVGTYAF